MQFLDKIWLESACNGTRAQRKKIKREVPKIAQRRLINDAKQSRNRRNEPMRKNKDRRSATIFCYVLVEAKCKVKKGEAKRNRKCLFTLFGSFEKRLSEKCARFFFFLLYHFLSVAICSLLLLKNDPEKNNKKIVKKVFFSNCIWGFLRKSLTHNIHVCEAIAFGSFQWCHQIL